MEEKDFIEWATTAINTCKYMMFASVGALTKYVYDSVHYHRKFKWRVLIANAVMSVVLAQLLTMSAFAAAHSFDVEEHVVYEWLPAACLVIGIYHDKFLATLGQWLDRKTKEIT